MVLASTLARAFTLSLVTVFHLTLLTLIGLTFAAQSGGALLIGFAVTDSVALLIVIYSLAHEYVFRGDEPSRKRGRVTFGSLFFVSLVGSVIVTVHAIKNNNTGVCKDAEIMPRTCTLAIMIIALSWVATITASQGLVIAHYGDLPGVVMVTPQFPGQHSSTTKANTEYKPKSYGPPMVYTTYNQWPNVPV
jgi:hypothetical protein